VKAPLRYAFGWVLFVAIFAALNPIVNSIFQALREQPLAVPVITAALALVVFITLFFLFLGRFYHWLDSPSPQPFAQQKEGGRG
jgi:cell division protein FtsX